MATEQNISLDQLKELLGSTGSGTSSGLFGLGDVATGGLLGVGQSLLSGLGGLLSGPSQGEKNLQKVFGQLQNQLGQTQIDPDQFLAQYMRQNKEQFGKQDEVAAQRTGMDSFLFHAGAQNRREQASLLERGRLAVLAPQVQSQHDLGVLRQLAGVAAAQG